MAKKLIAANWKEHPKTIREAEMLSALTIKETATLKQYETALFPPSVFLQAVAAKVRSLKSSVLLGAQDIFWEEAGAFTGGVGPKMVKSLGARYVIVGHSERRAWCEETDSMINKKVIAAQKTGLTPILCVGESWEVRKKGLPAVERHLVGQLAQDLQGAGKNVIVAYEPLWAIGSGQHDTADDAKHAANFIKAIVKKIVKGVPTEGVRVLYGGSVDAKSICDYVQLKEIDGVLVGGASVKAGTLKALIKSLKKG